MPTWLAFDDDKRRIAPLIEQRLLALVLVAEASAKSVEPTELATLPDRAELADDVVSDDDGRVRLKAPPGERRPRRGRSLDHLRRVGEQRAADADVQPELADVRQRLVGDELLARANAVASLEQKAGSGEPLELVTTSSDGAVTRRERPTIDYAGPSDANVRRVAATSELKPLRWLSERLAKRYGWQPAQATVYILTGTVPVTGVRLTTRDIFPTPGGVARWDLSFDADEDAEIVAHAIRRAQREHGIARKPKAADAERQSRLALLVARHGDQETARKQWNREQSDKRDRYPTRQSWHRAIKRAAA